MSSGIIVPVMGSKSTTINDRFFITNSMGYTHLGHIYAPNRAAEIKSDPAIKTKKQIVGDDLGSENYLLC